MGPNQTCKLLHSKGNYKRNEKITNRLRESIYKWCNQQGLNPKYTTHTTQQQKRQTTQLKNWPNIKINIFFQRRNIHGK